jgi:MYXO-CTERM domain-containing protein
VEREEGPDDAGVAWQIARGFPLGRIPHGAYARGRDTLRARRHRPTKVTGPLPPPWTPLGPGPLDTSQGSLETHNASPAAGRASAVAVDPTNSQTIYAGFALGGVWKTTDGGVTWAPLMDLAPTLAVGSLAIDPAAPDTLYVGTGEPAPYLGYSGEGILRSTDGGQTFTKIGGTTLDGLTIGRVFLDGAAGQIYATAFYGGLGRGQICNFDVDAPGQGLYRSDDGGATFTSLLSGEITDLEVDTSVMPRRLFVGQFAKGALRSDDGGQTWVAPAGLPTKASRVALAVAPTNPSVVYAGLGDGAISTVYVSQDGGKTFAAMPGAPDYCKSQCYYDNAVAVDPNDDKTVYVGGSLCGVWKTSNGTDPAPTWDNVSLEGQGCSGGNNWFAGYVHPDVHAIAFDPSQPGTVFAATDGGVARSVDGGQTWTQLNAGIATLQLYALCADPSSPLTVYGGSQDNGISMRASSSLTWTGLSAGDGGPCAVDPKNPKLVLVSGAEATIFRTLDGFAGDPILAFTTDPADCSSGAPGCGDRTGFIAPLAGDPSTSGTFYVGTYRVYQTKDGGAKWSAVSGDLTAGASSMKCPNASFAPLDDALSVLAVAPSAPGTIYAGSQTGVLSVTTNGGQTWTRVDKPPLPGRWISGLAIDPGDSKTVFASFSGFDAATPAAPGHVFRSTDGGQTWALRDIPADVPVDSLLGHPVGSGLLYAGTDAGLLVTTDGGQTWTSFDDGLPNAPVYALVYQRPAGALLAGTFGRSAWSRTFVPGTLSASPPTLTFTAVTGMPAPPAQPVAVSQDDVWGSIVGFTVTPGAAWLSVDAGSGAAAGATPVTVNASVDAGQLAAGGYDTTLAVTPSGGGTAISIPVHLTVKTLPGVPPSAVLPAAPAKKGGCGCRAAGEDRGGEGWIAVLGVAALLWRRRRSLG